MRLLLINVRDVQFVQRIAHPIVLMAHEKRYISSIRMDVSNAEPATASVNLMLFWYPNLILFNQEKKLKNERQFKYNP